MNNMDFIHPLNNWKTMTDHLSVKFTPYSLNVLGLPYLVVEFFLNSQCCTRVYKIFIKTFLVKYLTTLLLISCVIMRGKAFELSSCFFDTQKIVWKVMSSNNSLEEFCIKHQSQSNDSFLLGQL